MFGTDNKNSTYFQKGPLKLGKWWHVAKIANNYKKENRNIKGNSIAIVPTQIHGPFAIPAKWHALSKAIVIFAKVIR
jgi:hypothetical protein